MKRALLALALAAISIPTFAQVIPTGPFTGNNQADFETPATATFAPCIPYLIFNNQANICMPNGNSVILSGGWSFQCSVSPHAGTRMCGNGSAGSGGIEVTFTTPPTKFGGYFSMNHSGNPDITVEFFAGQLLVSGPTVIPLPVDCTWNWLGWDLGSTGVDRIVFRSNHNSTGYIHMDDLEADINACSSSYGQGCGGSGGFTPKLSTSGCPTAGANVSLNIDDGLGGATALLLLGANQAQIPVGGACFLNLSPVFPAITPLPLGGTGPGQGSISLFGPIPPGTTGAVIRSQVFVIDPGVIAGFSSTAGLELTIQ